MAAFNLPSKATYEVHETCKIDTQDNEDHTFCGVMFPIKAKRDLPIDKIIIRSIAVRGELGPMSVWVSNVDETPDNLGNYRFRLTPRHWTKIYEGTHEPSRRTYQALVFRDKPVVIEAGQVRAIYVHSELPGDEAIVYDNAYPLVRRGLRGNRQQQAVRNAPRYDDSMVAVYTGKAHLSPTPFGQMPIWGWGNAWRDHREFVGQIEYGCVYKLWSPDLHFNFGPSFQKATVGLAACRLHPTLSRLPDECLFYILNMCRWDWFEDSPQQMKGNKRLLKQRIRRRQQQQEEAEQEQQIRLEQQQQESTASRTENSNNNDENSTNQRSCNRCCASATTGDDTELNATVGREGGDDEPFFEAAFFEAEAEDVENDENQDSNDDDDDDEDDEEYVDEEPEEEDGDDSDSDGSDESEWERNNGYRADNTIFNYRDVSSDESEDDGSNNGEDDDRPQNEQLWFRRNFARIHILRALGQVGDNVNDDGINGDGIA